MSGVFEEPMSSSSGVFEEPTSSPRSVFYSRRFNMSGVFEEPPRCVYDAFVISLRSSLV